MQPTDPLPSSRPIPDIAAAYQDPMPASHPVLPLRDIVVFPGMTVPLFVKRPASLRAVAAASGDGPDLLLVAQRDAAVEAPGEGDLCELGTLARIVHRVVLDDDSLKLLVEGVARARLVSISEAEGYLRAEVELLPDTHGLPGGIAPLPAPDRVAAMQAMLEADALSLTERLRRLKLLLGDPTAR